MGYAEVWKTLEGMLIELIKKGVVIPSNIMEDLRSAKQMIVLCENKDTTSDVFQKLDEYLMNVEGYVVNEAQKAFGNEKVNKLLRKIEDANFTIGKPAVREKGQPEKFITGVPRDQKWIRVEPIDSLPLEKLQELAKQQNLTVEKQKDGRLIIYGQPDTIKKFVKQMTALATKA